MRYGGVGRCGPEESAAASEESDVVGHKRDQIWRELISLGFNDPEIE
jgi:hypothetical protein